MIRETQLADKEDFVRMSGVTESLRKAFEGDGEGGNSGAQERKNAKGG